MKNILFHFLLISSLYCIHIDRKEDLEKCIALAHKSEFSAVGWVSTSKKYCTGTLIHPRVVLTSAYTVKDCEDLSFNIDLFGKYFCIRGKAILHPTYLTIKKDNTLTFEEIASEIALIILDEPLYGVNYLKLPTGGVSAEKSMHAVGFGGWKNQTPNSIRASKLGCNLYIDAKNDHLMRAPYLNDKDLSLFGYPAGGDMGCPLISKDGNYTLQGIFRNYFVDEENSFSLFIDLFPHLNWIENTIKQSLKDH